MRLNKFIAHHSGHSRREADELIARGVVTINGQTARLGQRVDPTDAVAINGSQVAAQSYVYLALNKPTGYVCSRRGQDAPTVFELLPDKYRRLNTVGRLDKNSSGLILLTNDGEFAHSMTHPSFQKEKTYEVKIDKPLPEKDFKTITETGVDIGDLSPSRLRLAANSERPETNMQSGENPDYFLPGTHQWRVTLSEGRNRQIRRSFEALGFTVTRLHRIQFGPYTLNGLESGKHKEVEKH